LEQSNPGASEEELARLTSIAWKELSTEDRDVFMEIEAKARLQYKHDMAEWRRKAAAQKNAEEQKVAAAAL